MNNQDKAKKILFGRTDIGDKKWDYEKFIADNPEVKMNEEALRGYKSEDSNLLNPDVIDAINHDPDKKFIDEEKKFPKSESQWNDPEMTGEFGVPANPESAESGTKYFVEGNKEIVWKYKDGELTNITQPEPSEKPKIMNPPYIYPAWAKAIENYCTEQGISPENLIKEHGSMKETLKEMGIIVKAT